MTLNKIRAATRRYAVALFVFTVSTSAYGQKWEDPQWSSFHYPAVAFINEAQATKGAEIYFSLIPNPENFIQQHALWVVRTIYWSANDPIPNVEKIRYTLKDIDGISAKEGDVPEINIFYSSRWVEKFHSRGDNSVMYETRGVLYHELTHAYQLEPKGIGDYQPKTEFWAYIEGLADAVRIHNGFHPITKRKPGGSWKDGYQTTGFFLDWLTCKDPDFLKKFNRSTLDVAPWSFDKAMRHIFGPNNGVNKLWNEYQQFLQNSLSVSRGTT